jgi:hypothetical protein
MGSVARPINGETKRASRTVVPKLAWVTPTPILRDPRDANHAGSIVEGHHCQPMTRSFAVRISGSGRIRPHCEWRVSRRPRRRLDHAHRARDDRNDRHGDPRRRVQASPLSRDDARRGVTVATMRDVGNGVSAATLGELLIGQAIVRST